MLPTFLHRTVYPNVVGKRPLRVGVLALQGDVREHIRILNQLEAEAIEVRKPEHLDELDGLIIPGGESSVIDKLSRIFGVAEPLRAKIAQGFPVYGTCAGMIMLADTLVGAISGQQSFGGIAMTVQRNAFGSQTESFETELHLPRIADQPLTVAFIRAPLVLDTEPTVDILGKLSDGSTVAVQQGNLLATSFHPEITGDTRVHRHFLSIIEANR